MSGIPKSSSQEDLDKTAWAARYLSCGNEIQKSLCAPNLYNGTCWIERDDFTPLKEQGTSIPSRTSWHPGNRVHQLNGRILAFTLLKALHEVLTEWSETEGQVLPDEAWHITAYYDNIRRKVTELSPSKSGKCSHLAKYGFEFLCKVPFKVSACPRRQFGNLISV